ncbi:hypothetical protein GGS23DRAFT_619806 [Durotheca rogersii]|uniref:uncharacterized protein n=1 Tax=Durotheca rogersii TaxID=419775 RepID=UPI00221F3A41|nr:uncharacterized protein GGS23DRAFT_619806 [Durotheca rogersii]KAI5864008.1 hypothetical protein GGS23DRAFT_619806 [Durotheca rogersii]
MANLDLTRSTSKTRDPPPSLFPRPSPAASHVSLAGVGAGGPTPSPYGHGGGGGDNAPTRHSQSYSRSHSQAATTAPSRAPRTRSPLGPRLRTGDSARSGATADRADALWAEMQLTLQEIELSAGGGTHIFGPEHDRKLADLRAAQIGLAQAWARSEADEAVVPDAPASSASGAAAAAEVPSLKGALAEMAATAAAAAAGGAGLVPTISAGMGRGAGGGGGGAGATEATEAPKSTTAGTGSARPGSSGTANRERLGARLEEETERDILLARNRREANDRYFSKIDQGVRDVVEKLEEVAIAMRAVEEETRNIWADSTLPDNVRA